MWHLASLSGRQLLLEREAEQAAVTRAIEDARAANGRFVLLEAASGLGKSRLLADVQTQTEGAGFRTLKARGVQLEQGFGFGLVRQLLEPVLDEIGVEARAQVLSGAAAQAAAALQPASAAPAGDFAVLHGLYWLVVNLSRTRPIAMVVDDVHWADSASLKFLNYLLPRLPGLPLVVVAGIRPRDPLAHQYLIDLLITDPAVTVRRLAPLTEASSAAVVRAWSGGTADDEFCATCHRLAGGNPLLLQELVGAAMADGVPPTASGAQRLEVIGGDAIRQRIRVQLAALPEAATALAQAFAVLDEHTELAHAAAVAGLAPEDAAPLAASLEAAEILRRGPTSGFLHPLYRAAMYSTMDLAERSRQHRRAARMLADANASTQLVSAHLLHVTPAGDPEVVATLRQGAAEALAGAAPETALRYLQRALLEPPDSEAERTELLVMAGSAAQLVDWDTVVGYLGRALDTINDPVRRATIAELLGRALFITGRNREAAALYQDVIPALGQEHEDLRQHLQAGLINVTTVDASMHHLADDLVRQVRDLPRTSGDGGRMLDALVAWHEGIVELRRDDAVAMARRALMGGRAGAQQNGFADACWVLVVADCDDVMPILETARAQAHRHGSVVAAATVAIFRSLAWLYRGSLAEAEADGRQAMQLVDTVSVDIARPFTAGFLTDVLREQGRLDAAAQVLEWANSTATVPTTGHICWLLAGRGRLLLAQGRLEEGIDQMLACGRQFESYGWRNPAFLDWRSDAALALHQAGRHADARHIADECLQLAREWGARRMLGRAFRVAGLVAAGDTGLPLLHQAVDVLEPSPARLEYAKALHALGSTLRRVNRSAQARPYLTQALDLADRAGATRFVAQIRDELRAAGARPRRSALSGPQALTPSEGRVAELAAAGHTNRHIAQTLFVTPKTVEVHLSSVYRKLKVTSRREMAKVLTSPG